MKTRNDYLNEIVRGLLVMMLVVPAAAGAADEEAVEKEFSIGTYLLDGDSYRFGKYTGVVDDDFEPALDFRFEYDPAWNSDDPVSWKFQGWRVGLDSMRLEFDYHDQGTQEFSASFRQIPNYRFNDGMTPFDGVGTGTLELPANWVAPRNSTTDDFATLQENLSPVNIKWDRQRLDLSFERHVSERWNFELDWRHETKEGLRSFGGVIGNSGGNPRAVILPAPIDWETDIMEAAFEFGTKRYQFGFSVYASWFDNSQESVTWQNPYGRRSGWATGVGFPDGLGLYSLEPDNEAFQARIYGGLNVSPTSRLSADFAFGSMDQNDALFDYTVNQALRVDVPLPRETMDAEIETTRASIRYTARPLPRVGLVANYRKDERDNKTPRDVWVYIGGDSENQRDPDEGRINLPYSYEKEQLDLTATWRATKGVRFKGGFETMDYNRSYSEVLESDERRFFGGVSLKRWERVAVSLDVERSDRDVDAYQGNRPLILSHLPGTIEDDAFENLPGLRKYNQTDRSRDEIRARVDVFASPEFNYAFSGRKSEDKYDDADGLFGLQYSEVLAWTFDMGWYPREGFSLTAYYTSETYDSTQANRSWASTTTAQDPDRNWFVDTEDQVDTWNVALNFTDVGGKFGAPGTLEFGIDYTYSNVESDLVVTGAANIDTAPLPLLVSEFTSWSVFGSVAISDKSSIRFAYEQQDLRTDDFTLDDVPVDGPSNVLLLGESAANYDLNLLMLTYSYRY